MKSFKNGVPKKVIVLLIAILTGYYVPAQLPTSLYKDVYTIKGDYYLDHHDYPAAIDQYTKSVNQNPRDAYTHLRLAEAYEKSGNVDMAGHWYEKAFSANPDIENEYLLRYLITLHKLGKHDALKRWVTVYNTRVTKMGTDAVTDTTVLLLHNMKALNSDKADASPALHNREIIFFSDRDNATYRLYKCSFNDNGQLHLNTFNDALTSASNDAVAIASKQGKVFFTGPIQSQGGKPQAEIFYCDIPVGQSEPLKIDKLSFKNFDSGVKHPAVNSNGTLLFFTSNNSKNGFDLYKSEFNGKKWSAPKALNSSINSKGDELYPSLQNDSILYFASNGHGGMGGLDIYRVDITDKSAPVEHLKAPFNSASDDYGLVFNSDNSEGYLVSNRPGGTGDADIYAFYILRVISQVRNTVESSAKAKGVSIHTSAGDEIKLTDSKNGNMAFEFVPGLNYTLITYYDNYKTGLTKSNTIRKDLSKRNIYTFHIQKSGPAFFEQRKVQNVHVNPGELITFQFIPNLSESSEAGYSKIRFNRKERTVSTRDTLLFSYVVEPAPDVPGTEGTVPLASAGENSSSEEGDSNLIQSGLATNTQPADDIEERTNTDNAIESSQQQGLPGNAVLASASFAEGDVDPSRNTQNEEPYKNEPADANTSGTETVLAVNSPSDQLTAVDNPITNATDNIQHENVTENTAPATSTPASALNVAAAETSIENKESPEEISNNVPLVNTSSEGTAIASQEDNSSRDTDSQSISEEKIEAGDQFEAHAKFENNKIETAQNDVIKTTQGSNANSVPRETNNLLNAGNESISNESISDKTEGPTSLVSTGNDTKESLQDNTTENKFTSISVPQSEGTAYTNSNDNHGVSDGKTATSKAASDEALAGNIDSVNDINSTQDDEQAEISISNNFPDNTAMANKTSNPEEITNLSDRDSGIPSDNKTVIAETISSESSLTSEIKTDNTNINLSNEQTETNVSNNSSDNTPIADNNSIVANTTVSTANPNTNSSTTLDESVAANDGDNFSDTRHTSTMNAFSSNENHIIPDVERQNELTFRVQIAASRTELNSDQLMKIYNGPKEISRFKEEGYYKYYIDEAPSYQVARQSLKESGVNDAFIAAYNGDTKLKITDAIALQEIRLSRNADTQTESITTNTDSDSQDITSPSLSANTVSINKEEENSLVMEEAGETEGVTIDTENNMNIAIQHDNRNEIDSGNYLSDEDNGNRDFQFRVQIAASKSRLKDTQLKKIYEGPREVRFFEEEGYYKYYIEETSNYYKARRTLKESNIDNAFISVYKGSEKWQLQNAIAIQYKMPPVQSELPESDSLLTIITVNFEFDEFVLADDERTYLKEHVISQLKTNSTYHAIVNGYTDIRGSEEYNFGLSQERAVFVEQLVIDEGVQPERVTVQYFGESQVLKYCPEESVCDESIHQANRRVEILLLTKKHPAF